MLLHCYYNYYYYYLLIIVLIQRQPHFFIKKYLNFKNLSTSIHVLNNLFLAVLYTVPSVCSKNRVLLLVSSFRVAFGGPLLNVITVCFVSVNIYLFILYIFLILVFLFYIFLIFCCFCFVVVVVLFCFVFVVVVVLFCFVLFCCFM